MKDRSPRNITGQPIRLQPLFRERIWGKDNLRPYFASAEITSHIGEVWFTHKDNRTSAGTTLGELLQSYPQVLGTGADPRYPGICPLLLKFLFTAERLSVQVHPDDEYAAEHHQSLGKTEAWYVMDSKLPGEVAVGFREEISPEKLKEAASSGEIETLLAWRKVSKGDVVFTPAGTVHAIGAGLAICEIQQNSDITYRLYDYGRPRELHLDHGARVSNLGPHTHTPESKALSRGREELLACDYFRIERLRPTEAWKIGDAPYYSIAICIDGQGTLAGESCRLGDAFLVPAHSAEAILDAPDSEWILTYKAGAASHAIQIA